MAIALRSLIARASSVASLHHLAPARAFVPHCASPPLGARPAPLLRLRPLVCVAGGARWAPVELVRSGAVVRCFSTRPTTSSLNDPSPNWSNRPPKETILLDGCDFEHWLVVMEPPEEGATRDDIIDSYIKTLAQVVGSEEEARMKIYSVSTRHYFAFGALVSEELSYKIKALPRVRWVLPDSYLDVPNKDYGGEPFINGQAVPYDPKYHEEWVRNNARANERSRRNDRPRNFDRSRNFERRREIMQNRDFQNRVASPTPNQQFQNSEAQNPQPPRNMPPSPNAYGAMPPPPPPPPSSGGAPSNVPPTMHFSNRDPGAAPNPSFQGTPNRDYQNQGPSYLSNYVPNRDGAMPVPPPPPFSSGNTPSNVPPTVQYSNRAPGSAPNPSFQGTPNRDYQNQGPSYSSNYVPSRDGAMPPPPPAPPSSGGVPSNVPPTMQYSNRDPGAAPNPSFQGTPNRDYRNQGSSYSSNYVPNRDGGVNIPGTSAYLGGAPGNVPHGSGPSQGSGSAPQGFGNVHQGGGGPYQGDSNAYQVHGGGSGGGGGYAGDNVYQGGGGSYQGSSNAYQGGGGGDYPGGGNAYQGAGGSFGTGGDNFQGRDMPSRD